MSRSDLSEVGMAVGPFTENRQVLNLGLIASQLLKLHPIILDSARQFDLEKLLECLCKFLVNCQEGPMTWHNFFDDEDDYRDSKAHWQTLVELYWTGTEHEDKDILIESTLNVYASFFDEVYQPIMAAFLIKVAEALNFDRARDVAPELLAMGDPWIQGNFLTWGQPLSLSEEIVDAFPFAKALRGSDKRETESKWFSRNCEKYKLQTLLIDLESEEMDIEAMDSRLDASALRKEIYDLMAARQMLSFYGIYLEKYQDEVLKRSEYLTKKITIVEKKYNAVVGKEMAEQDLLYTLGGTLMERTEKLGKLLNAVNEFGGDGSDTKLARRVREILGLPNIVPKTLPDAPVENQGVAQPLPMPPADDEDEEMNEELVDGGEEEEQDDINGDSKGFDDGDDDDEDDDDDDDDNNNNNKSADKDNLSSEKKDDFDDDDHEICKLADEAIIKFTGTVKTDDGPPEGTDASRKRKLSEENGAPSAPKHAHVVDKVLPSIRIATGDAAAVVEKKVPEKEESSSDSSSSDDDDDDDDDDSSDDTSDDDSDDSDVSVSSSEGKLYKPGETTSALPEK